MEIHHVLALTEQYSAAAGSWSATWPSCRCCRRPRSRAGAPLAVRDAVTVLPATDIYLMGRERDIGVVRGVADANFLSANGVICSSPATTC